jgi:hypothetical protein
VAGVDAKINVDEFWRRSAGSEAAIESAEGRLRFADVDGCGPQQRGRTI